MPVTASLSDASRQKLDGIVAQMQKNGESDSYIQGVVNDFKGKYGGMGTSAPEQQGFGSSMYDQTAGPIVGLAKNYAQHIQENSPKYGMLAGFPAAAQTAWDVSSGVSDQFLNALHKTTAAIKSGDWATAAQQAPGMVPFIGAPSVKAGEQISDGNYAGAAGTLAGVALAGKSADIVKATPGAVQTVARVAKNSPAVVKAIAESGVPKDIVIAAATSAIPVVGTKLSAGMVLKAVKDAIKDPGVRGALGGLTGPTADELAFAEAARQARVLQSTQNRTPTWSGDSAAPSEQGAPVATPEAQPQAVLPSGRKAGGIQNQAATPVPPQTPSAPPQVSTKVQIPTKFSPESTSDTMGTRAPSAAPTAASEAAPLDQATHQRLATSTAQLRALPHDAKVAVTQAMKDGDATKINAILDLGRVPTSSEMLHIVATNNKVATIMEYAQDHGIDLGSLPEESRDTIAHAAYANRLKKFAEQNGIDLNALSKQEIKAVAVQANLPKSGYTGTHEGSFGRINNILAGAN